MQIIEKYPEYRVTYCFQIYEKKKYKKEYLSDVMNCLLLSKNKTYDDIVSYKQVGRLMFNDNYYKKGWNHNTDGMHLE